MKRYLRLLCCTFVVLVASPAFADETEIEEDPDDIVRQRLGPFSVASDDGDVLEIGGAFQMRGVAIASSSDLLEDSVNVALQVRRARGIMRAHMLEQQLHMAIQINTVPGDVELLDAWAEWHFPMTRVRFGQWKVPYGRYRDQSFTRLLLNDWSKVAAHFGAERQLGVQWYNPRNENIPYSIGVFTGVNSRASFERGLADAYAEPLPEPSGVGAAIPKTVVHPEVIGKVGYNFNDINLSSNSDADGGGFRAAVMAGFAYDFRPVVARDFLTRATIEFVSKYKGFGLDLIAHTGAFERYDGGGADLGTLGALVEAAYRILPDHEVSARYGQIIFSAQLREDAKKRAQDLIDLADDVDKPALEQQYELAGRTARKHELAVGYNVYFLGHYLKWQSELLYTRDEQESGAVQDVVIQTQMVVWF